MKPNVIFLTIDSFRADKCFGDEKTSKTPNLDALIQTGVYFSQTISAADQTGASISSIFTGIFPIRSGLNQLNFTSDIPTFFDSLKKEGYDLHSFTPDIGFFLQLTSKVENKIIYDFCLKI